MAIGLSRRSLLYATAATVTAGAPTPLLAIVSVSPSDAILDLPSFVADDGFDVQVRGGGSQGTDIRITGDTIIVDAARLTSLIAPPSTPKTAVRSLVFDARLLILRGPLALEGGKLTLLAETLRFERGAQISLLPGPSGRARHLEIVTRNLVFNRSSRRPIDLHLGENADAEFTCAVQAGEGTTPDQLWGRVVDSIDQPSPPTTAKILASAAAGAVYETTLLERMEWPSYFAAKVRKHFNRAPFDEGVQAELGAMAQTYLPQLEQWREPGPYTVVSGVLSAIRNQTDLGGRGKAFTPKEDLASQRAQLASTVENDRFGTLTTIISATAKRRDDAQAELQRVRSDIGALDHRQNNLEQEIDRANERLQMLAQRGASTDVLVTDRQSYLRLMQEREYERLKDAQAVRQWTTVAAAAVVIAATMGGATPAVAAAAGTGVALTGEAVYRHNIGAPMSLVDALAVGAKTYAAAAEFQRAWAGLKDLKSQAAQVNRGDRVLDGPQPPAGQPDTRKPLTKMEANKRFLTGIAAAVQKAAALNGSDVAAPTPLTLSQRENEDEDMKALLARRAEDMYQTELLAAQITTQARDLESLASRLLELQAIDASLRAADPQNDQENARWNANAVLLWGMNVERISRMVATYKKSLYFETGRTPRGVANVLDYPNEMESKVALGLLDPLGGFEASSDRPIADRLAAERAKFMASVSETLDAIDDTYTDYLNSRTEAHVSRRSVAFSQSSRNDVVRAFLETINGQIRQQIVGDAPPQAILPAYIPYALPISLNPTPERLLRATVVDVDFGVPKDRIGPNAIEFTIIHPGYGEMRRANGEIYLADFRTTPTDWKYFGVPAEQISRDWLVRTPTVVEISRSRSDRFYTYYPARTPYFLVVAVHSRNWRAIPEIRSIEFGFEVMQ